MKRVTLVLSALLLLGTMAGCPEESVSEVQIVEAFYKALNAGDAAKAQSYVSVVEPGMRSAAAAMAECMAGKVQKIEILDIVRADWGAGPVAFVYVKVTCAAGVPPYPPGFVNFGKTCGDVQVLLGKLESGWKIISVGSM